MDSTAAANAFKSPRLVYRAIEDTDDDFLYRRQTDYLGIVQMWHGLLKPASKAVVQTVKKHYEDCLLAVVICLPAAADAGDGAEPTPIGNITLAGRGPDDFHHHRRSAIGVGILPEYQGKGYGSEAIEWILEWGFHRAGLHRIGIACAEFNDRAWALYERLGFIYEGRQRDSIWSEGRFWDRIDLGMLEHEWRVLRDKKQKKLLEQKKE